MIKNIMIPKNILYIIGAVILVICVMSYGLWIMLKTDRQNVLSLLTEGAHTGLANSPMAQQLALGGNSPSSNLAQENPKEINPSSPGGAVALGNLPVLFDISAQPLFGKNGLSPAAYLLIIFAIPVLALFFLYMWNSLKKRRIKK